MGGKGADRFPICGLDDMTDAGSAALGKDGGTSESKLA